MRTRNRSDSTRESTSWLEEALLVLGLALLVTAAWPQVGQAALAIPGAVLVWIVLPARCAFVERPPRADGGR